MFNEFTPFIIFGLFALFVILSLVFLGIWTYKDAKSRGLDGRMWTAIVILIPNLIGLLIYFLVGRNQVYIECDKCKRKIQQNSRYCMNCGNEVTNIYNNYSSVERKSIKKYMVGFISCIVIFVMIFICFIVTMIRNPEMEFSSGYSIMLVQTNIGDKWSISFSTSTETFSKTIKIKEGAPKKIYVEFTCEEGEAHLTLKQYDKEKKFQLTNKKNIYEIDLSEFNDGKLKLYLEGKQAKKVKFKAYWE
ncbi:MAG: hypothetical protein KID00_09940 [Clostridium argentinense]|uniref:Zinc ribbon domain-containing protein n=1 Tax=Clostridium faecium TaxID=2762223 RepID=A0ABR8YU19_9CLOT|nr:MULTISPECIES: hypothetical protein [Clostridium]MBD8047767.1 hypothetical protein [Clostridium faecium]MBS5824163.1 hypothetical protein [Clostridium argentinense]MDU1350433.1 hypothetical protein [Clostridium argentinense]